MLHLMQHDRRKLQELASQSAMAGLLRRLLTEKKQNQLSTKNVIW